MRSIAGRRRSVHLAPVAEVDREPSAAELAEIEREVPLFLAEFAVIEAEAVLTAAPESLWARRAHRRAVRHMLAVAARLAPDTAGCPLEVA